MLETWPPLEYAKTHRVNQQTGKNCWYFRVLNGGSLTAPITLSRIARPQPDWTIAACNTVMYHQKKDLELTQALAAVQELAEAWKDTLRQRAEKIAIDS